MEAVATRSASEVMSDLLRRGYTLSVITRTERRFRKGDAQAVTYAGQLWVEGPQALPDDLREAIREHRDELLAAACVISPPVPWLRVLVQRYRDGWDGPRVRLAMVAANVAGLLELHPAHDGPRLEPIIEEALR